MLTVHSHALAGGIGTILLVTLPTFSISISTVSPTFMSYTLGEPTP
jgi:hypothetical protein